MLRVLAEGVLVESAIAAASVCDTVTPVVMLQLSLTRTASNTPELPRAMIHKHTLVSRDTMAARQSHILGWLSSIASEHFQTAQLHVSGHYLEWTRCPFTKSHNG